MATKKPYAKTYAVTLTGITPLLLHHDNIGWAETMQKWTLDPANKKISVKGDDRSPAWRWIGALYVDSGKLVIPSDNLMTFLREGGARISTGKGQETFKRRSQSGLVVDQAAWPIKVDGKEIPYAPFEALIDNPDFALHEQACKDYGFELFCKRAKISQSAKHVRVRPRFNTWSCAGTVTVLDDLITDDIFSSMLELAGAYAGLCDWRPSSPKSPGSFGQCVADIKAIKR